MKTNVVLGAFADEAGSSIEDQIAAMEDNGIRHLEARNIGGRAFITFSDEEAKIVKQKLDAKGMSVWSIGSPLGKIGIRDDMEKHLDALKHTLELARIMGSSCIRMFSFYIPQEENPAVFRDEVMDRLNRMVETARGSGVLLCHENEKEIYGDVASRCRDILQSVPELGGIFDPANFIQCGQDTLEAWDMLGSRIRYMHVKDCVEDGKVVPCGKGIGHVPEIIGRFLSAGGSQLTLEPHLTVFQGFADLEKDEKKTRMDAFVYGTQREAFDAAARALKDSIA